MGLSVLTSKNPGPTSSSTPPEMTKAALNILDNNKKSLFLMNEYEITGH
jgi:alkaline phosphatase